MTRYQAGPAIRPDGLLLAAAVTLGAVSTIMLVAPDLVPVDVLKRAPTVIIFTPLDPPPPPKPQPQPRHKADPAPRETRTTIPDPIVRPPVDTGPAIGTTNVNPLPPPLGTGQGMGDGSGVKPVPPPPVLVGPEIDPKYAGAFQPVYPSTRLREGVAGLVTVRVLIGTDGRVKALEPVGSNDADFLEATRRRAFSHWRFRPATRDGVPYETWKQMRVRFDLTEE
ncbi:energy transducer TonB [Sphingomonas sp.]|uniref:energy transducer TonB n=1 Tax=Sphingomonas sp. TaxID=28214 RepID=UPI001D991B1A|nr:energy transducer TonB [Sphingomonas sp.]MBX9795401.1 energy transducer TonB [Sphingomonas sp.]